MEQPLVAAPLATLPEWRSPAVRAVAAPSREPLAAGGAAAAGTAQRVGGGLLHGAEAADHALAPRGAVGGLGDLVAEVAREDCGGGEGERDDARSARVKPRTKEPAAGPSKVGSGSAAPKKRTLPSCRQWPIAKECQGKRARVIYPSHLYPPLRLPSRLTPHAAREPEPAVGVGVM